MAPVPPAWAQVCFGAGLFLPWLVALPALGMGETGAPAGSLTVLAAVPLLLGCYGLMPSLRYNLAAGHGWESVASIGLAVVLLVPAVAMLVGLTMVLPASLAFGPVH